MFSVTKFFYENKFDSVSMSDIFYIVLIIIMLIILFRITDYNFSNND